MGLSVSGEVFGQCVLVGFYVLFHLNFDFIPNISLEFI